MDTNDTKFLPEDKVKPLLEKIVNRTILASEWNFLLSGIGTTSDGDVPYENVIAVINHRSVRKKAIEHTFTTLLFVEWPLSGFTQPLNLGYGDNFLWKCFHSLVFHISP